MAQDLNKIEELNDVEDQIVNSEVETVDEETLAAKSLHPKAAPGEPMTKVAAMASAMTAISGMSKEDLNKFAETMGQFGKGKDWGVGDKSASNAATLKMKPSAASASIKEDVAEMFDGEDLTEEFKVKASTLFEAAVSARIIAETARLEEEFETKLSEELASFTEEVTTKVS